MRIAVLCWRDLSHPHAGGSEVYAQQLAGHWAAAGHDVTFVCAAVEGRPRTEEQDGYRIIRGGSRLTVYRHARSAVEAMRPAPDVVLDVVNTRPFMTPRWCKAPHVALIYQLAADVWYHEMPAPAAWFGQHVLEPRWLRAYRSTPVLTISESTRAGLDALGLAGVTVVPVGVERPADPGVEKAAVPTLVWVGRLAPNKRPDHAVQAHAELRRTIEDAELHVVGDGPMSDVLRAQAAEGVTFHGRLPEDDKWRVVASAHALLATSVREGWGMTVSEAALVGTRSIGYDVPGLRDSVAAAGGVLVAPSPSALAGRLAELLPEWSTHGRTDLGDAGVTSWAAVAAAVLAHLEAAAAA